ncbi:hypothetical protein DL764_010498 [Monosporascus ibericus]|uniref:DUF302 domain-containing protein n=1 Tax=Monosporascus ibericus TaxID=155417 RepID=A0A4Q4SSM1_9PEZI|nr:hypothetical protein DL764_010498 [Monosporascus ibericus]
MRAALEEAIPPMDYAYRAHLESDNCEAALEALEAFPRLNNFTEEPRDFGRVETSLHLPVTVLLRTDDDGMVAFEYDRPRVVMRQFGHRALYDAAEGLDCDLYDTLCEIAGRDEHIQWNK